MKRYFNLWVYTIFLSLISFIPKLSYTQTINDNSALITVSGRILDKSGMPVSATIVVKGKTRGTTTDTNGKFILKNVNADAQLIITGVSLETQVVALNGRQDLGTITITNKEVRDIEVVIEAHTGYQTLKPNEMNGSIVTIDSKKLNQQVGLNILKRLDGITNSLLFSNKSSNNQASDQNISIRGIGTINGPLEPLIVLDNFIYEGDINNLNPNDVKSISILKDAQATSIYGPRGGNGVIVITTKKGAFDERMNISYNNTMTFSSKPDIFYPSQISSSDYIIAEEFLYNNGFYQDDIDFEWYYRKPFSPALQIFIDRTKGTINQQDSLLGVNQLKLQDVRNDYRKYFYTNALTQQYNVNLKGGGKNNAYTTSINYDRMRGSLYEGYNKLNIHLLNSFKAGRNLLFTFGAYYTNSNSSSGRPANVSYGGKNIPYIQLQDEEGRPLAIPQNYSFSYTDTAGSGRLLDWKYYPLEDYKHNNLRTYLEELNANVRINLKILKGFDLDVLYQYQRQNKNTVRFAGIESFYTRNLINLYSQVDYSTGKIKYVIPNSGIQMLYNDALNSQNLRSQLNFDRIWNRSAFKAIGGLEVREISSKGYNSTLYGYNDDPLTIANADFVNQYSTLPFGSLSALPGASFLSGKTMRYLAAYSNFSYILNEIYSISGSIRKDGANIFGVNTNDKWKPLWSLGAGWEISKENFYKSNLVSFLRFRFSYGYSGNIDPSKSALPIANYFNNSTTNLPYTRIQTINNPDLRWEQSRQINLAADFKLLQEIITGNLEFYWKRGSDLYGLTNYDYTTWGYLERITKNVASMAGKGIDLSLVSNNLNRNMKWTTELLLSYNKNKVTRYFTSSSLNGSSIVGSAGNTITPVVGKPVYAIAAYKWRGLDEKGDPQGILDGNNSTDYVSIISSVDKLGIDDNESITYFGSAMPVVFGSIINTFSWRRFSASINMSYRLGYYFKKANFSYNALFYGGSTTSDFSKRWQKPGDENITNIPSMVYTNYPQFSSRDAFFSGAEINVLKGDHLRIHYININYLLRVPKANSVGLRLYTSISNVGVIWRANNEKIDPENPSSIPVPRTYAVGLQATF